MSAMYWRRERQRLYRAVACPTCHSAVGEPCRNSETHDRPTNICYARRTAYGAYKSDLWVKETLSRPLTTPKQPEFVTDFFAAINQALAARRK